MSYALIIIKTFLLQMIVISSLFLSDPLILNPLPASRSCHHIYVTVIRDRLKSHQRADEGCNHQFIMEASPTPSPAGE